MRVGRFILLERLGAGAMGEIYAAYDEQLDRRVALKLVRHGSELSRSDDLLLREAQALAQVSHPNVVQIYEADRHEGRLFIAMELIRGQTLTGWLAETARLPRLQRQREILRSFIAAGRGLEAAHAAGVAHRDFKPDNVLVGDDGRVRVVDFGLARAVVDVRGAGAEPAEAPAVVSDFAHGQTVRMEAAAPGARAPSDPPRLGRIGEPANSAVDPAFDPASRQASRPASRPPKLTAARLTETGLVMGTPRFMAPEQIRGAIADHRSDQFSFCVALYHALHGAWPFPGERMQDLLHSMESRVLGSEHSAGVAVRVRNALRRGLSVNPSQRFASMGELLAALESSLRRRREWVAGAVLVSVLVALAVYFRPSGAVDPCAKAGDGIDAAWSAPQQLALRAAFGRSDLPYKDVAWQGVKERIDGYTSRWRNEAIAACRVTHIDHVQSEQLLDRRMLCLDRGRSQVAALVSELSAGAPRTVQRAVEAAEALPAIYACSDTESMMYGLEPPPAGIAREVAGVREQLAQAVTLERLGRPEESLVLARNARATTERLKYPAVHAEAFAQVASTLESRGNKDARSEARELYLEALDIAEAERHDQLAASIWTRLAQLATRMDDDTRQAHAWWRRTEAAVRRIGGSPYDRARLHAVLGEIQYRDGKFAEAADQASRAITAISAAPEHQIQLSSYYAALAKALEPQDRIDEALQLHERALGIARTAMGPAHPYVIRLQTNYAKTLEKHGQLDRARAVLDSALASMPPRYRESHIDAGRLYSFLSEVSYRQQKPDDAVAEARRSLQLYQSAGAPEHDRAYAYFAIGNAELLRKNFTAALASYQNALSLRRAHMNPDNHQIGVTEGSVAEALAGLGRHDDAMTHLVAAEKILERGSAYERETRSWMLTLRGEVLVGRRQLRAAIPVLEEALPMFEGAPDQSNTPRAMWALARALHGLGKDPARVRQLAERASMMFATLGIHEARNRDSVERFIERLSPVAATRRADDGLTR